MFPSTTPVHTEHDPKEVAVITGAGADTGAAIARCYARHGMRVVLVDIDAARCEAVAADIDLTGSVLVAPCDIANAQAIPALFQSIIAAAGRIDVLVNCAGPYFPRDPLAEWIRSVEINLLGTLHMTRHALEVMRAQGSGAIVNIASDSGLGFGPEQQPAYGAAKAGIMRFTAALHWLQERHGIRVNCVTPDWIGTRAVRAMLESASTAQRQAMRAPTILISEEDFAEVVYGVSQRADLAGRIVLCWSGKPLEMIEYGDRGYCVTVPYGKQETS
jgi:NAD(P)-dependent dehydrogenase (short-subunit alcohol dehydrogenase family)